MTTGPDRYVGPAEPQKALIANLAKELGSEKAAATAAWVVAYHVDMNASERMLSLPWQGWAELLRIEAGRILFPDQEWPT